MAESDVDLRPAQPSDVLALVACARAAYHRYIALVGEERLPIQEEFTDAVTHGRVTVAVVDGEIAGYIIGVPRGDTYLVENMAVTPLFQGRGIGSRLLAHAEKTALAGGAKASELFTHAKMVENIALYKHRGYVESEEGSNPAASRVHMRKVLADG